MHKINALILAGLFIAPLALSIPPAFSAADSETRAVAKLIQIDRKIGDGAEAVVGKTVEVHYTGWLYSPAEPNNKGRKLIVQSIVAHASLFLWVKGASSKAGIRELSV